jgi:hypothetical protein
MINKPPLLQSNNAGNMDAFSPQFQKSFLLCSKRVERREKKEKVEAGKAGGFVSPCWRLGPAPATPSSSPLSSLCGAANGHMERVSRKT